MDKKERRPSKRNSIKENKKFPYGKNRLIKLKIRTKVCRRCDRLFQTEYKQPKFCNNCRKQRR